MNITLKLSGLGILFLIIIVTGLVMAKSGKPYNPVLFNIHKLISLATVLLGGIWVYNLAGSMDKDSLLITLIVAAMVLYILLFITGGMLNLEKPFYDLLRFTHKITSPIVIIITIILFYILLKK